MSKARERHTIIFLVILEIAYLVLIRVLGMGLNNIICFSGYYQDAVFELIAFLLALFMARVAGIDKTVFCPKKIFTTFKVGAFLLFCSIVLVCASVVENYTTDLQPFGHIVAFGIYMLLVGLTEELLFRGIIENILLKKYGNSYKGIVLAVVISGMLFGLAHLGNVSAGIPFEKVAIQAIQCIAVGFYFGAIYARTRNLWGMAILHAFNDFALLLESGIWGIGSMESFVSDLNVSNLVGAILYVGLAIYLLGRKEIECDLA